MINSTQLVASKLDEWNLNSINFIKTTDKKQTT